MTKRREKAAEPSIGDKLVEELTNNVRELLSSFAEPEKIEVPVARGLKTLNGYDQL